MSADSLRCWVPGSFAMPAAEAGPLRHRSVAVKDLFAVRGHVSSFGHPRWRETHAPATETAPVVERLIGAGASVRGMAKLDQLAYSLTGSMGEGEQPINPVNPGRFTGGSSSGSASAVAGGEADLGLGTDTAGSIRVPAAACGLFGYRPTHGLVDSRGVLPLAPSFDVVGLMARDAELLLIAARVLAEVAAPPVGEVRVLDDAPVEPFVARAVEGVAAALGGRVVRGLGGLVSQEVAELFSRLQGREVWAAHGDWVSANEGFLAEDVRRRLARAKAFGEGTGQADESAWAEYRELFATVLRPGSIAVMPVLADLPPLRTAAEEELVAFRRQALLFNAPAGLAGAPVVVVPVRAGGSVTGVGLMGRPGSDGTLLEAARALSAGDQLVVV
ncbi:amidase [Nonomuraea solani]|uniref:Amidase n=1 Tax=Nonomuraea solani TaxID=1144553 RepID=A0A1H6CYK5_9ACTN|nr:amidase family protein [Nonomuraea solani]SEG77645.1 amidase [Nonomuraea solani]